MLRLPNFSNISQYKRVGAISLVEGLEFIRSSRLSTANRLEPKTIFGVKFRCGSNRLATFLYKGTDCVNCGRKGSYFALEWCKNQTAGLCHLNLWGITDKGIHFLMTSDHIMPKSKGGEGSIQNRQPMCAGCNSKKGNLTPEQLRIRAIRRELKLKRKKV